MKNRLGSIIGCICLLGAGIWLWSQRPGLAVEKVLPDNPFVVLRVEHVREHISELIHLELGRQIARLDIRDLMGRNGFALKDINDFERWHKDLLKFWDNALVQKFLDKELIIAGYADQSRYHAFAIMRLNLTTRAIELLGQLSHHWGEGVTLTQQSYKGRVINYISFKKQSFKLAYVRIRDLLIFAPGSSSYIKDVIDVYQHQQKALLEDESYNQVLKNSYPHIDGLLYVNLNFVADFWRLEMNAKLKSLGYKTAAFPVYALFYEPGVVSKFKMVIGLDEDKMTQGMRKVFECQAPVNDSFKLVPANAIAYNWGACYDFDLAWAAIKSRLKHNPVLDHAVIKFKRRFERHFDINLKKDVLPILGHEIGGYLTDVDMQGNYPFPRLLLFVSIQNRSAADKLLIKLVNSPLVSLKDEVYHGVMIQYLPLPIGPNMDPGYCFLGDYLLVASSRQLLKKSIDAYADSMRSLVSDDAVEQFSLAQGHKFHSVTLMKTAELSHRLEDFLGWVDKYLSGQISMAAAYKQDGYNKQLELDQAIADKKDELILAQHKLSELKNNSLLHEAADDEALMTGAIANLTREEQSIREDIITFGQQKRDLTRLLTNYALGAQHAKLAMYNMEYIFTPVLKSLESIDTQAVTVRFTDKMLETEFFVK